jgi:hypothetical protein
MPLHRSNVRFKKGLRGDGWATLEYYGGQPGAGFNSLPAFITACGDLGPQGGELRLGPWAYRFDGTLPIRQGVSLRGIPDATFILGNHATLPLLEPIAGTARNSFTEITGIGFGSLIGATGAAIHGAQPNQRWKFRNCTWNWGGNRGSPLLNGNIFSDPSSSNSGCVYEFENCWAKANQDGQAFTLSTIGSQMNFRSSKIVWPATLGATLVYYSLGQGSINDLEFDATPHTAGTSAACIGISSSSVDPILIDNVKAIGSGGPAKTVLKADSGVLVRCTNLIQANVNRYLTGTLASGSYLEMLPHQSAQSSGFANTIPDNISAYSLRIVGSPGVAPAITMPSMLFPGQELELTLINNSGGSWSQVSFTTAYNSFTTDPTADSFSRTYRFKVMSMTGSSTYNWVCIGTYSSAF